MLAILQHYGGMAPKRPPYPSSTGIRSTAAFEKATDMGMYFAVDASYSIDDTYSRPDSQGNKYMYLALVVVGDFVSATTR